MVVCAVVVEIFLVAGRACTTTPFSMCVYCMCMLSYEPNACVISCCFGFEVTLCVKIFTIILDSYL